MQESNLISEFSSAALQILISTFVLWEYFMLKVAVFNNSLKFTSPKKFPKSYLPAAAIKY